MEQPLMLTGLDQFARGIWMNVLVSLSLMKPEPLPEMETDVGVDGRDAPCGTLY
jgi:hypothetical protein